MRFSNELKPDRDEFRKYRYRKQYGVNLGSWFALERWIAEAPFQGLQGSSELDVVQQAPDAEKRLEAHWDSWMSRDDWQWIAEHGFNTVRLPIGYYHVCGLDPTLIEGTEFAEYHKIYSGAWLRIIAAIRAADMFGIGVLIDLHAAPGAQNKNDHSGTPTGQSNFWTDSNTSSTTRVLQALALELHTIPNVVGLSLLNEPDNDNRLQGWYESTITSIRDTLSASHDRLSNAPPADEFPLYIDDARDPNWYSQWVGKRDDFVVMDRHVYRCFTPQDGQISGEEHATRMKSDFRNDLKKISSNANGNVIVGEWSAGLQNGSMPKGADAGEMDRQRRVFVSAQKEVFDENSGGQFFWCYKKGQGWDAGWSARDASLAAILPKWVGAPRSRYRGDDEMEPALSTARHTHIEYWMAHNSTHNEVWRFEDGFRRGWKDAELFTNSELGYIHRWTEHRVKDHTKQKGPSDNIWEFRHGFEQGFRAARVQGGGNP